MLAMLKMSWLWSFIVRKMTMHKRCGHVLGMFPWKLYWTLIQKNMPVRCYGTQWISHKWKALQHLLDRYWAYINHLATLSEDQSIASADGAWLKAYCSKWMNFKMLIGAAMYNDILKFPLCLSLTLREEKLDVIKAIQHLLKARKLLQSLSKQNLLEWPSFSMVYNRIVEDVSSKIHSYQGIALINCNYE